jgi:hypothetical protein
MNADGEQEDYDYFSEGEALELERRGAEMVMYICSQCGLIANETIDHRDCGLQDWWIMRVKFLPSEIDEKGVLKKQQ